MAFFDKEFLCVHRLNSNKMSNRLLPDMLGIDINIVDDFIEATVTF